MKFLENKYFLLVIRIIIGAVFIYASLNKLFNPHDFAKAIFRYDFTPVIFINIMAIILPWLELIIGTFLIFGIYKKGNSLLASAILLIFLIALISAYARGLDINCGCFSLEETSSKSDILVRIIEDIFMFAGTLILFFFSEKKEIKKPVNEVSETN